MLHIGSFEISRTRMLGILALLCAVMVLFNVSVAGLPLIPVALILVALALLW